MGALLSCVSDNEVKKRSYSRNDSSSRPGAFGSSRRWSKGRSERKRRPEEAMIQDQALAAALLLHHNGVLQPIERSSSLRFQTPGLKKETMIRSSSMRSRSVTDPLVQPHQFVGQDLKIEELDTRTIVLIHGGGFGAWCWYKTMVYLEECGFRVIPLDLTGSGVHSFYPNQIKSLFHYCKPLLDFLENLPDNEKVILVGHDLGGTCISYAMEVFPCKIAKSVFIAAPMLKNGQSTLDIFSLQEGGDGLMREAQEFYYANGVDQPPTSVDFKKSTVKNLLFNQSPNKDVALASVSMRALPFAPLLEKLSLSGERYGSVRRYYIETTEDNCIFLPLQQTMCSADPPEKVFRIKGADHSPFFSKPQALHKILVEISKI